MFIPKQSPPIGRVLGTVSSRDGAELPAGAVDAGNQRVVPSSLVDAFMYAIRGPSKEGHEGPILVSPGGQPR